MRCRACDVGLTEPAIRRKMPTCGEYWDLCTTCLNVVQDMLGHKDDGPRVYVPSPAFLYLAQRGFDGNGNARTPPAQTDNRG